MLIIKPDSVLYLQDIMETFIFVNFQTLQTVKYCNFDSYAHKEVKFNIIPKRHNNP